MDSQQPPNPMPLEEPLRFSLRMMFLLVSVFAVGCAGFFYGDPANAAFRAAAWICAFLAIRFLIRGEFGRAGVSAFVFCFLLVLPIFRSGSRGASRPLQCQNNLKQIGLALLRYREIHGHFPPAYVADAQGRPLYSWRVLILPMLEQEALLKAFHLDQAWNAPNNAKVSDVPLPIYSCPSDPPMSTMTDYVAVVGPNTAWPGAKGSKLSDFKDPSNTILVVEVARSGIQWAEPRDLYSGQAASGINPKSGQGISSLHKGGASAVFADGSVHQLPNDIDPQELAKMLEIDPNK